MSDRVDQSLYLLLPRTLGDHPRCVFCGCPLSDEEVAHYEFKGLIQVIAGKDAHDIVDVTYTCRCGGVNHVRFAQ